MTCPMMCVHPEQQYEHLAKVPWRKRGRREEGQEEEPAGKRQEDGFAAGFPGWRQHRWGETWRLHSLIAPLALRVIFISVYFISLQSIWVKNKRKRWAKPPGIVLFSQVQFNMNGASTSSLGARCRTNSNTESCILGKIIPMRWLLTLVPLLPLPPGPPGPAGSGGGSGRALL